MTPEICLISVPHNGTMFAREILVSHGWHDTPLTARATDKPALYMGHCEKFTQWMFAVQLGERMPVIMPLRHPYRVEESWRRRDEDANRMVRAYKVMLDIMLPHVDVWLPIDASPRMRELSRLRLSEAADKELHIDWNTVINGQRNTHDVPLCELDPSDEMIEIYRHPLFLEFYGEEEGHAEGAVEASAQSA